MRRIDPGRARGAAAAIGTLLTVVTLAACGSRPATQGAAANDAAVANDAAAADHPALTLPVGTAFSVRVDRALSTERNRAGDTFTATLDEPVVADGKDVLPRGTRFNGHVTVASPSGRLKGRAVLGITLDAFDLDGRRHEVTTSLDTRTTEAHKKRNLEIIGGGTGIGALIGGLTGGGKGAVIGATVGAGAGTGAAAATGRKNVEVPAGTLFRFSLKRRVAIAS